jgi:hypothetical protein
MKMSHVWKSGSRKKKTKPTYKIRWELLGLSRPDRDSAGPSIDTIRNEVSVLAAQGLSERTRSSDELSARDGRHQSAAQKAARTRGSRKSPKA